MKEILRIKIPLMLIALWFFFFGFRDALMTIAFLGGFMGFAMLLGHLAGKEIFSKYKWDVGKKLNDAWDFSNSRNNNSAILAVGMLMARVFIYVAIVIGLALCLVILKGNAFGADRHCEQSAAISPEMQRARLLIPILKEEHAVIWPDSRIEVFASQISSESRWKETAKRVEKSGVISYGLMQVLDVTLIGMRKKHTLLADVAPVQMMQARWGIRAGLLYDKDMWTLCYFAEGEDRYAFMLASYNGGFTWVQRDRVLTAENKQDKNIWFGNVERFSRRSPWAFNINRRYVKETLEGAERYRDI